MAEAKQDLPETPEEEVEETPEEELIDETSNDTLADFLDAKAAEDAEEVAEEEPVVEEDSGEPEEETEEEAPIEIPVEEITEEARKDERERVKKEILEAIGVGEKEKEIAEETDFVFAWEARGEDRPASWKENNEETIRLYEHQRKVEAEARAERQAEIDRQNALAAENANVEWDKQIDFLVESGELPAPDPIIDAKRKEGKILTAKEREDPGIKAQAELFERMYFADQEAIAQGSRGVTNAVQFYHQFLKTSKPATKKPAGAKAPVSGGRMGIATDKEDDMSYEELAASDFHDIIERQ